MSSEDVNWKNSKESTDPTPFKLSDTCMVRYPYILESNFTYYFHQNTETILYIRLSINSYGYQPSLYIAKKAGFI